MVPSVSVAVASTAVVAGAMKTDPSAGLPMETVGAAFAGLLEEFPGLVMPVVRWLFEYSRDNFERQRRVNQVLFACIQELAIENAALRQQIRSDRR